MENANINTEYVNNVRILIGSWIKKFRKQKNLTLKEVADLLEIKESTVSKIENGKWLSLEMLIKLSVKLDFYIFLCEKDSNDDLAVTMRNRFNQSHTN